MKIDSILLCAGKSSRMKEDKALLDVRDGVKTIDLILDKLKVFSDRVIIVLGDNCAEVKGYLGDRYQDFAYPVLNPIHLEGGMLSSVKKGIETVSPGAMAMLNLIDQPFIKAGSYQKILDAYKAPSPFVIPVGRKEDRPKKGHPILFAADFLEKVIEDKTSETFRDVLLPYYAHAQYVDVLDQGITENLNTKELFLTAKARYEVSISTKTKTPV